MKVAFITPCVSRLAGGIFEIERRLAQCLHDLPETTVCVFGPRDKQTQNDLPAWRPIVPETFPFLGPSAFRWSPALRRAVMACDADLAHLHALWMHTSLVTREWHHRTRRPYLTTLNGMLEPWALRHSAWKKRLAAALFERDCLRRAGCIQVNTEGELQSARAYGLKTPICIIPNGIDLPVAPAEGNGTPAAPPWAGRVEPGRKVLLYLGRLHPKKGLVNLLQGWAATLNAQPSTSNSWILAIAGWDQLCHEAELKNLCGELNLPWSDVRDAIPLPPRLGRGPGEVSNPFPGVTSSSSDRAPHAPSVLFLGPQHGDAKAACYAHCDAFILPSFSEGLPMVVLEAWAYGKPVLMTPECNLPVGYERAAALRIEANPESIARGLAELLPAPRSQRETMGAAGRRLVAERYQWSAVARDLRAVYAWLLGGGAAPATVVFS